jgi:hypothetical protein
MGPGRKRLDRALRRAASGKTLYVWLGGLPGPPLIDIKSAQAQLAASDASIGVVWANDLHDLPVEDAAEQESLQGKAKATG